jgi:(p)ppGpp synthase/HD superfamily hydrolase
LPLADRHAKNTPDEASKVLEMQKSMDGQGALDLAGRLHAGQVDKQGLPYITHLVRVRDNALALVDRRMPDLSAEDRLVVEIAALLHDAIEDTPADAETLRAAGVPERAIGLVEALSRPEGEGRPTYQDWIEDLASRGDPLLVLVKLADNIDNGNPARIARLPPDMRGMAGRYGRARVTLEASLDALTARDAGPIEATP